MTQAADPRAIGVTQGIDDGRTVFQMMIRIQKGETP